MGTPGHMAHPFDVSRIQTGQDLVNYFYEIVDLLNQGKITGSVKIDGINVSFKLVTDEDGKKDFRMDRGTTHTESVIGMTAEDAFKKWGPEHGMPYAIKNLLNIFNTAIPIIEPELKKLGMWDNPTKFFNTEYVEGKSNVQEYDSNFLAIHGINQFYEKKGPKKWVQQGISLDRPGLPRPVDSKTGKPIKKGSIEVEYDKEALISLIEKVKPIADERGFEIYGDIPAIPDLSVKLDLKKALNTKISIQVVPGGVETAPLSAWLKEVDHPQDKKVTKANGDIKDALSKDIYLAVLQSAGRGGIPLNEYLADGEEDTAAAISGAIFYHTTRVLGQAIKESLTSDLGSVGAHEGVVLRGLEDFLVKLTGDFIVQGLASTHGDREDMIKEWFLVENRVNKVIAIYPGRFQPMGRHHFQTFQEIAEKYGLENTFIATSAVTGPKSPLNFEEKKLIMMKHGIPESQIVQTKNPYAAREVLEGLDPNNTAAVYLVGGKDMAENPRFDNLDGVLKDGTPAHLRTLKDDEELLGYNQHSYVGVAPHVAINIAGVGEMCGTSLRACLGSADPEQFEAIMGWFDEDIYKMLQNSLKEISAAGAGAVAGHMDNRWRREDHKNERLVNEVMDYLLGITVG